MLYKVYLNKNWKSGDFGGAEMDTFHTEKDAVNAVEYALNLEYGAGNWLRSNDTQWVHITAANKFGDTVVAYIRREAEKTESEAARIAEIKKQISALEVELSLLEAKIWQDHNKD